MVYHLVTSEQRAKAVQIIDQHHFVYMQAEIQLEDVRLTIIHHRLMPYIAFAKLDEELSFQFLTISQLHKYFLMRKCLTADTLNKHIVDAG